MYLKIKIDLLPHEDENTFPPDLDLDAPPYNQWNFFLNATCTENTVLPAKTVRYILLNFSRVYLVIFYVIWIYVITIKFYT